MRETFDVEAIAGADVLARLGDDLDELHEATAAPVTARRPWLAAWVDTSTGLEPWALAVRDRADGRLAAVALLSAREVAEGVEVANLGHGRNDRGHLPARSQAAARALACGLVEQLAGVRSSWRLRLEQLPARDPVAAAIVELLPTARSIRAAPVPKLAFADGPRSVDGFLGKGLRKQLRRCRQRLHNAGVATELAFASEPSAVASLIDDVERTHRERDHSVGRASDLDDARARAFWRRVILDHGARGEVEIATLRAGGELAAYVVSLLDRDSYRVLDGRFAPGWARFSPGRLVETATIARALADERFRELDWMNSVASEKLVAANALDEVEHLVACSADLARRPDPGRTMVILDEEVEGRPTAERALAALVEPGRPGS